MNYPNYTETPIGLSRIWNGKEDGDDDGYRYVAVSQLDEANPDPLVALNDSFQCYREGHGNLAKLTGNYGLDGYAGFTELMLLREPAARHLRELDRLLEARYGRQLLLIDAFRPLAAQAEMWRRIFLRLAGDRPLINLSVEEIITLGRQANVIAAYAEIVSDQAFVIAVGRLRQGGRWIQLQEFSKTQPGVTLLQLVEEYLKFLKNLGAGSAGALSFDLHKNTAHGSGGAVDTYLTHNGQITCLGVPYDYIVKDPLVKIQPCRMDFFEDDDHLEPYRELQAKDDELAQYLYECGVSNPCSYDDWCGIRDERRILYGSAMELGMTFYIEEPWHWQPDNSRGGKQADIMPGNGNACHAILRNRRDPETGEITAVWGNFKAHELARAFGE